MLVSVYCQLFKDILFSVDLHHSWILHINKFIVIQMLRFNMFTWLFANILQFGAGQTVYIFRASSLNLLFLHCCGGSKPKQ